MWQYKRTLQEEDLGSLNDLSEEVRKDIDNLYVAKGIHVYILTTKRNTAHYSGVTVNRWFFDK